MPVCSNLPRAPTAGVRKAPMHEIAASERECFGLHYGHFPSHRVLLSPQIGYALPMPDDTSINIVDSLKGQHVQLRRLLAQQSWIASASTDTLSEIDTQLAQIKSVLAELERIVGAQLVALRDHETLAQMSDKREIYRSPNG